jgi:hypothetical protein
MGRCGMPGELFLVSSFWFLVSGFWFLVTGYKNKTFRYSEGVYRVRDSNPYHHRERVVS